VFDPKIRFVILIHGREAQKRIATGRMSHLCLQNSLLLSGYDYSRDDRVNSILEDDKFFPVILYPGKDSLNLTERTREERNAMFPAGRELVVFVIDGTWITARKTLQRSKNLRALPQVSFTPSRPSRFRVRKQPKPNFFSTLEAIHQTIELVGEGRGFDLSSRSHDALLHVFDQMVEQQLELSSRPKLYCQWSPRKKSKIPASDTV
jgi:DTW domain-containing protein YfiP